MCGYASILEGLKTMFVVDVCPIDKLTTPPFYIKPVIVLPLLMCLWCLYKTQFNKLTAKQKYILC